MEILSGNLIDLAEDGKFDIIVHGCNCFNTMGAGIACEMRHRYPDVYIADCKTQKGAMSKLGTYTQYNTGKFIIINAYTQYRYGYGAFFNCDAFTTILHNLIHEFPGYRFGFPLIGCGLAKGDRKQTVSMLEEFHMKMTQTKGSVSLVLLKDQSG